MNNKLFLKVMMILISFGALVAGAAGQADERLMEIGKLTGQGKPEQALVVGRKYLKDLRETLPEADHPAIGYAAIATGVAAAKAGEHEEAVLLIREGLPMFARMRAGQLWADELTMSEPLVSSLEALKRTDEGLAVLGDLLERTRKELARRIDGGGLKVDQPGGPSVSLEVALVNEDSLAVLLERRGNLQLGLKRWESAEKDLKEAEQILRRIHPDEQQARLAKLREGWEQAARQQGKPVRPHLVGRFSMPRTIRIEGASEISNEEIYSALTRSSNYLMASHPSADFETYLKKLRRCLELGYLSYGFPETRVEVEWDEAGDSVVARIQEGPRFKAGAIRIQGAKALEVDALVKRLVRDPDAEELPLSREEEAFLTISELKHLSGAEVKEVLMGVFPESFEKGEGVQDEWKQLNTGKDSSATASSNGVWEAGAWVDYQESVLSSAERLLQSAYAEEGLLFPKFELKRVPGAAPDLVDLLVEVVDEGPPIRLGKLHLSGNRINTREEVLSYLGLEEGMDLKGDYMGRVKRRLYESGRFLGWEVTSRRAGKDPGKMDLVIQVAEEWEAPPLAFALTREQVAVLKFAKWMNSEAGEERDLVFGVTSDDLKGSDRLELAVGREGLAFAADMFGYRIRSVGEWQGQAGMVIHTDQGGAFLANFQMGDSRMMLNLNVYRAVTADPFKKAGNIAGGLGISSLNNKKLAIAMDPAQFLKLCQSEEGFVSHFDGGEMVLECEDSTLRFDERTGRLIHWVIEGEGQHVIVATEDGAMERIKEEMARMSEGVDNWVEGKSAFSLMFLAMAYGVELIQEDFEETDSISDVLSNVAGRTKRWEPLAVILGDVSTAITETLQSITERIKSNEEDVFSIPIDYEDLSSKMRAGSNMSLLLALGGYDAIAAYIEPGTWPDLVARELLFYLDGKPFYLNQSIETLLEDDDMGPMGCLLCARLLKHAGHAAAAGFVAKARTEMNAASFAKDWSLVLRGTAKDRGTGWKILKALRKLDDGVIDGLLPAEPPTIRSTVKHLVAEVTKIDSQTDAGSFGPVMDSVWDNLLETLVQGMVDDMEDKLTPKMDPSIVAATVNGHPVLRGAVRLMEKLQLSVLMRTQCSALSSAWQVDDMQEGGAARSKFEDCVTTLLFAQQMWKQGKSATPDARERWAEMIAKDLGSDGWDQIEKAGLTRDQFKWWVGALIAAEAHGGQIGTGKITKRETRAYYDRHKKLFGDAEPEVRLYTIRLKVEGDGGAQRKLMQKIRKQVEQAKSMDEKVEVFFEQAERHSDETDTKKGGERGWVQISGEFRPEVSAEIVKVPEQSLSEVIEVRLGGQGYLYLALIPEKKRPGKAKPFEQLAPALGAFALLDRERMRLRNQADICLLDEPTGKDLATKSVESGIAALADKFLSAMDLAGGKGDKKDDGGNPEAGKKKDAGGKKEKLSLELVTRKAAEGSEYHIYVLGTYAERGLIPENGIQDAVKHYERAADGGNLRAMLRLSELYRVGRVVDADDRKAREWKEKVLALRAAAVESGRE